MKHLAANIYTSNQDSEIFDIIIDQDIKPKNWNNNFVKGFWSGLDFGIILFNSADSSDKFQMFYFQDVLSRKDSLEYLATVFKEFSSIDYDTYKKAQNLLLDVIYMYPTYRAIFKYVDKTEDTPSTLNYEV
jgi:hypothetical protein